MAYTTSVAMALGNSKAGLTLAAKIVDTAGVDVGAEILAGFVEIGSGTYILTLSIPDGQRGAIKIYQSGVPATILAIASINPEEIEYDPAAIDAELTASHGSGLWGDCSSPGLIETIYTVTLPVALGGAPIPNVNVWITTDVAGNNIIGYDITDSNGVATFHLDAGTYYVWRSREGYFVNTGDDSNPETIVVTP